MIRTRALITDLDEVPREWVFENYLRLREKLSGQDVMVLSPFNPRDTKPSLHVYVAGEDGKYKFCDFSTGKKGDGLELVVQLLMLPGRGDAADRVMRDYEKFLIENPEGYRVERSEHFKYRVTSWSERRWNTLDQKYWTAYSIGSDTLERFLVRPLESFVMEKPDGEGGLQKLKIARQHVYGYFRSDGTLAKIYQPMVSESKFIKVADYLMGSEQLKFEKPYLVIGSSGKDIMTLHTMNFGVEVVSAESENIVIKPDVMEMYKSRYRGICTLFDNDAAGIAAMVKYKNTYGLPYVHLKSEKDISDSVKTIGHLKTKQIVFPLLKEALKVKL